MKLRLIIISFLFTLLGTSSVASADTSGIMAARAAGIKLAPAVLPLMRKAPSSTCLGNPTLFQCGTVRSVKLAPSSWMHISAGPPSLASMPVMGTDVPYCDEWANAPQREYNLAYGWGGVECSWDFTNIWMWVHLNMWNLTYQAWRYQATSKVGYGTPPPHVIGETAYYRCRWYGGSWAKNGRYWSTEVFLHATLSGILYAFTPHHRHDALQCIGTR